MPCRVSQGVLRVSMIYYYCSTAPVLLYSSRLCTRLSKSPDLPEGPTHNAKAPAVPDPFELLTLRLEYAKLPDFLDNGIVSSIRYLGVRPLILDTIETFSRYPSGAPTLYSSLQRSRSTSPPNMTSIQSSLTMTSEPSIRYEQTLFVSRNLMSVGFRD